MKKALNLIIMYFITLFLGIFIGTVLYSFYINVLNFVAGTEIKFFAKKELLDAFFYVTFCVLFIICLLISYYRVRHPGGIAQIITFICLSCITWMVLIPSISSLSNSYVNKFEPREPATLSKKYFRQSGDKVYYFTEDLKHNVNGDYETEAIVIDTAEDGVVSIEDVVVNSDFGLVKDSAPYKEILVKNTFSKSDFPLAIDFRTIISNCEKNMGVGLLPFLGYLSLGFAISALFALTCVFHWNLINTTLITVLSFFILIINSHPSLLSFMDFIKGSGNSGFGGVMSSFGCEPILALFNTVLAFIFILIGIITFIVRKHKAKYI